MVRVCGDDERLRVKELIDEDFVNYKKPVMYIGTAFCSGKCYKELGMPETLCQNHVWKTTSIKEIENDTLISRYLNNPITQGICFGGLEPFEQFDELKTFIKLLRNKYQCNDVIIIYTGFNKSEILNQINELSQYGNIIVKFGRFIPYQEPHYDDTLGVKLISNNQYAQFI